MSVCGHCGGVHMSGRGVNPGVGGSRPPDFGQEGSWGVVGGRGRVSENTIAYFAQKVC